ncbi:hypothetical protein PALB_2170 [Pseudoalteromonas luteoviolacea B = ATCC 29581]|nr:hypothetical protein PALB_2170 [Pseudoalteromonas luteoviolacea B = ATCC 29581]
MNKQQLTRQIEQLLFADIAKFWLNLYQQKYTTLIDELANWPLLQNKPEHEETTAWLMSQTIAFLKHRIDQLSIELQILHQNHRAFIERINHAELHIEKNLHTIRYAQELGSEGDFLEADKEAFERWFDEHAVISRYQNRCHDREQLLKFLISKLGEISRRYLALDPKSMPEIWQKLNLQSYFEALLDQQHNLALRQSTFRALVNLISLLYSNDQDLDLQSGLLAHLVESLEQPDTPFQARIDILEILIHQRPTFVRAHMWALFSDSELLKNGKPNDTDGLFIQCAFARILFSQTHLTDKDLLLLNSLSNHIYPRVRQSVIEALVLAPDHVAKSLIDTRLNHECDPAVRFTLVKQLTDLRFTSNSLAWEWWKTIISQDNHPEVKRLALELTPRIYLNQSAEVQSENSLLLNYLSFLSTQLTNEPHLAVRRVMVRVKEQLVSFYFQSQMVALEQVLNQDASIIKLDKRIMDADLLGRLLSIRSQTTTQFSVSSNKTHWLIEKRPYYGFRLWRFLFEWRNPSTDKRASHNHTTAYKPRAEIFVPSPLVAEISKTQVPGEPLFHQNEQCTRGHLPHLDHLLSILSQDKQKLPTGLNEQHHPVSDSICFTPDGILLLNRPNTLWAKLKAYFQITRRYCDLDLLRHGSTNQQQHYLELLEQFGFSFSFVPYGSVVGEPVQLEQSIQSLYKKHTFIKLGPFFINLWLSFKEYSISIYQNSVVQLLFFVSFFCAYFFARHVKVSRDIIKHRTAIPISIGGWGTRGKSGTERLKAALFSSLGLKVVSKTTGCEAMMIYSKTNGDQFEIPLFRPFDKASIWEQGDVLAFAAKVKADVFLWECMGLNPRYVRILRRWMRDNFTTITNAYPDHEDILGPRGIDVAKEMSAFIGEQTQVFTSEQTMMPILDADAKSKGSSLIQVHWGDGFQITKEIRALYPYEEHPDNIALVCKMASYIGIRKDIVFKETAKRIIPDVGVLQVFGPETVGDVQQSFINGMSANERLATIENWRRLELATKANDPNTQIVALINNRNDRVARSRVFADIVANDLSFDHIVIVGTNVDGFMTYLKQALFTRLHSIIERRDEEACKDFFRFLHVNRSLEECVNELKQKQLIDIQLSVGDFDELLKLMQSNNFPTLLRERLAMNNRFSKLDLTDLASQSDALEALLSMWQACHCTPISDPYIAADTLALKISSLRQGAQAQILFGMQNIKGPGLTFVNAWQKWQKLKDAMTQLSNHKITTDEVKQIVSSLVVETNYNIMARQLLMTHLPKVKKLPIAQSEFVQADLGALELAITPIKENDMEKKPHHVHPILQFILQVAESFMDAGAAVNRKKTAIQIYQDIADERITIERAVEVLRRLNRSQKPGWLLAHYVRKRRKGTT